MISVTIKNCDRAVTSRGWLAPLASEVGLVFLYRKHTLVWKWRKMDLKGLLSYVKLQKVTQTHISYRVIYEGSNDIGAFAKHIAQSTGPSWNHVEAQGAVAMPVPFPQQGQGGDDWWDIRGHRIEAAPAPSQFR